jgi:NADP-dependent 3-hydroxy acid dehydrogenase YdfG
MRIETDQKIVITGGAGGIAGAVAEVFADAGARLALVDLEGDTLRDRAGRLGAVAAAADLTDPDATRTALRSVAGELGGIDGLIHTTGGFAMAPADELDLDLYEKMLDLNLRTLVVTFGVVLPGMLEAGGGFLAAFAAGPAWHRAGGAGMSVYAATKNAVAGYVHAVQDELGDRGIRTALVYPMGVVDTPGNRASMPDADRSGWIDPSEIGRALLFAATRGPRGQITELPVFGGTSG